MSTRVLRKHYKHQISDYSNCNQKNHAEDYLIYAENVGKRLSIDEVYLSKGELYTYVINKAGKGKKSTLVSYIKGTKSEEIIKILQRISLETRKKVKEITLDRASNMESASRISFPEAMLTTDHFHVKN